MTEEADDKAAAGKAGELSLAIIDAICNEKPHIAMAALAIASATIVLEYPQDRQDELIGAFAELINKHRLRALTPKGITAIALRARN